MNQDQLIQKPLPSLKSSVLNRGGFGFYRRDSIDEIKPETQFNVDSKRFVEKIITDIDEHLKDKSDSYKNAFIYKLADYDLGGLIASMYEMLGHGHKSTRLPRWFYEDNEHYREGIVGIEGMTFDHFSKTKNKDIFTAHPYGLSYGYLKDLVKWCEDRQINCDISAESNYFPTKTIKLVFRKSER